MEDADEMVVQKQSPAPPGVRKLRWKGKHIHSRRHLSRVPHVATNQRAEITAIMLGLEMALERYGELDFSPRLNVTIKSDSEYAVECMNEFIKKWSKNGWINSRGVPVANQDLIRAAHRLDGEVRKLGRVKYAWIPRELNEDADGYCND
jgi:ribonuclease HI